MTRIKICGLARREDALEAARLGADFVGFVLSKSPRRVTAEAARPWVEELRVLHPSVRVVAVFVRPAPREVGEAVAVLSPDLIQIHGLAPEERPAWPAPWIRAVPADVAWRSDIEAPTARMWDLVAPAAVELPVAYNTVRPEEEERRQDYEEPWAVLVDTPAPGGAGGSGRSFDWTRWASTEVAPGTGEVHSASKTVETEARSAPAARAAAPGSPPAAPRGRAHRLFLAGGLGPDNVAAAIRIVAPWAVDASSRLEAGPGRKDPELMAAFVHAVRAADAAGGMRP